MDKAILSLEIKLVRASDSVTPLTLTKSAVANDGKFLVVENSLFLS